MMESDLNKPHSHIPYGEKGSGYYSENTLGCFNVIKNSSPIFNNSLENYMKGKKVQELHFADYGTADGGTSLPLFYEIISKIRETDKNLPITVFYEDQPTNDWMSLHYRLQSINFSNKSYITDFPNTFYLCSGVSFYRQCFPPNSIDIGFSSTAMHWLSKKPCDMERALHHTMAKDAEKKLFAEQAKQDWNLMLANRAKELKEGGYLIIINFNVDNCGHYLGNNGKEKSMHMVMNDIWFEFVHTGKITMDEYVHTNFINYYRSKEEMIEPLRSIDSDPYKLGLQLSEYSELHTKCPFHQDLLDGKISPQDYADRFIPTVRTWSNSTFRSGLHSGRSETEKDQLVDEFFNRYKEIVKKEPFNHSMDYFHGIVVMKKVGLQT